MSRRLDTCVCLSGIALTCACILVALQPPPSKPPDVATTSSHPQVVTPETIRQQVRERAEAHLTSAEHSADSALVAELQVVEQFFADARRRTPEFAQTVLGFESKWACLTDSLPGSSGDGHARYLQQKFEEHLFAPQALEQLIQQVVHAYLTELENIDHQLLVAIAADLEDLPQLLPVQSLDTAQRDAVFAELRSHIRAQVLGVLQADIGQTLVSIVTGEVLTAVAARMGASAGILGSGVATSWTTLGAGFIVGLIVDEIVALIWDWWADPRGHLVQELNRRLAELESQIIEGTPRQQGLRWHLQDLARRRTVLRRRTLLELLDSGDSP